jgi:3-hydroxyisobutyrate dehydrogenase-like beta-hydroxyacid dehydrogenase
MAVVGVLHPGEMGAAVGRCLVSAGHTVLWNPEGRGPDTAARAAQAGLTPDPGLAARCEVIISVCPPAAALDVARGVRDFTGIYVDANAISPATSRQVAGIVCGADFVDGGIIGGPPSVSGETRLYLSGERAASVQYLFTGTPLDARPIAGSASALKMAYAAWTKGTAALLLAIRDLARAEGVDGDLLAEWALSQPGLEQRSKRAAAAAAAKGWRWTGEMEEIAASMAADGLPPGFHQAAAGIYRRFPRPAAG